MNETFWYQSGNTITQFNGELIAHVSSELPSKERHTEFDLFITEHSEWLLQGIGRSKIEGETDRMWAVLSKDPTDVLQAILGNDVSRLAKRLIAEALKNLGNTDED